MTEQALVKNAADPEQVKKGKLKEQLRRRQEIEDLLLILSTRSGRRFVWRLLTKCKVFESGDASNNDYRNQIIGRRDIGLWATAEIMEVRPEAYMEMMLEEKSEAQKNG